MARPRNSGLFELNPWKARIRQSVPKIATVKKVAAAKVADPKCVCCIPRSVPGRSGAAYHRI